MPKQAAAVAPYVNGHAVPILGTLGDMDELDNVIPMRPTEKLSFLDERLVDLRIKTMQNPPTTPYWNTTMVTAWSAVIGAIILILSTIVGLYLYTWERAEKVGIEKGRQQVLIEQLTDDVKIGKDAEQKRLIIEAAKKPGQSASEIGHEKEK